jgi:Flp pilus assembly protein TadD
LGRSAEALVALEQAIKLERNSPEAWMTQGQALMNLQRYDDALAGIDKALQLQPNDAATLKLRQQLVKNMAK